MNNREKSLEKALQQEVEIPEIVWEKANTAFRQIETGASCSLSAIPKKKRISHKALGFGATAAVLCLVLGAGAFFAANPALAAKLPIIGRIFEQIEDTATFSGDYASKAQVLTKEEEKEDSAAYTVSDQGMTMTASEVYCDGMAIYLTFQVEYEGDFGEIPSHYTDNEQTAQTLYTFGTWSVNEEAPVRTENNYLEGIQLDAHTFSGMMRLDLNRFPDVEKVTDLKLSLNRLGADNMEIDSSKLDDIGPMLQVDGAWNFQIPIIVDQQQVQTLELNQTNENGYGVLSITKSPYQLTVRTTYPGYRENLTEEDRDQVLANCREQLEEDPEFTPEDIDTILANMSELDIAYMAANGDNSPEVIVFTQDGVRLRPYEGLLNQSTFAVQEEEITSLQVFVGCDDFGALYEMSTPEEAARVAYFQTTVTF